jgi:DNA modification methylase
VGRLTLRSKHRLCCGDSTKPEDVALVLDGCKPLLMVTDPPYGVEYDASWRNEAMPETNPGKSGGSHGVVHNDNRADWREAWQLFPGDVAYVWHAPGKNQSVVLESLRLVGFEARNHIIWAKNELVIGRGHYHHQHEPCLYEVR